MSIYNVQGVGLIVADEAFVEENFPGLWELMPDPPAPEPPAPSKDASLQAEANEFLIGLVEGLK